MLCLEGVASREGVSLATEEARKQWGRAPGQPGCGGGPLLPEAKLQGLGLVWSRLLGTDILTRGPEDGVEDGPCTQAHIPARVSLGEDPRMKPPSPCVLTAVWPKGPCSCPENRPRAAVPKCHPISQNKPSNFLRAGVNPKGRNLI